MGTVAQTLGIGAPFTYKGVTYCISPWIYEIQGLFERYLEKEALEACRRSSKYLTPDEARDARADVIKDIAAGIYTFGGELVGKVLDCKKHVKYLAWLMLKKNHPEVTPELIDEIATKSYGDLLDAMKLANATPEDDDATSPNVETPK